VSETKYSLGARVGDEVSVFWSAEKHEDRYITGIVKYVPAATGDSWIIWGKRGDIYHVQQYELIRVLNRKADQ
jgi:hypothetical protein